MVQIDVKSLEEYDVKSEWLLKKITLMLNWYEDPSLPYRDPTSQELIHPVIIDGELRSVECKKEIVVGDRLQRTNEL